MTSKVKNITLPGSGEELAIRAVVISTILMELKRQFPQPAPPQNRVNYGTPEKPDWRIETNYADPDYIGRTLPLWNDLVNEKMANIILNRGVVKKTLTDEQKQEVADVRQEWQDEGVELKGSDFSIWLRHIACHGDGDMNFIMDQIRLFGDPTAGVESEEDSFRS